MSVRSGLARFALVAFLATSTASAPLAAQAHDTGIARSLS